MEVRATAKFIRVQPRKVRLVASEIKGKAAVSSAHALAFHPSKGAFMLRKVLVSAIANAMENHKIQPEALRVSTIMVDEGPKLRRVTQKSMGRGARIVKKMSHITVVLEDDQVTSKQKPTGTKAKARPKFDAPKKAAKPAKAEAAAVEEAPAAPAEEEVTETPAVEESPATETTAEEAGEKSEE